MGRPLPGQDFVSGLLFYTPVYPVWIADPSDWAASTPYTVGEQVLYTDGNAYQCITAHTSGNAFVASYWELISPYPYTVGAEVIYTDGKLYKCITANSDASFTSTNWVSLGTPSIPSGWIDNPNIALFSPADANTNGILLNYNKNNIYDENNFIDAVPAQATVTIGTVGLAGDTIKIVASNLLAINENAGGTMTLPPVTLCNYTLTAADVNDSYGTVLASNIAAAINANKLTTGFSATGPTTTYNTPGYNVLTVNAPRSQGSWLNTGTNFTVTATKQYTNSTLAVTSTPFANGQVSLQAIWYYHISEFFRMQPQGQLYVGINPIPTSFTFGEISSQQVFSGGIIRQVGVYIDGISTAEGGSPFVFNAGDLTTIHTEITTNDDRLHMPLSALYCANIAGTTDLTTLPNLSVLSAYKASAVISQDGSAFGNFLYQTAGFTIGNLGALLGTVAFGSVSDDIMWVGKFNISNGQECNVPAFGNGTLVSSVSQNLLTALDNNRYIFLLKYIGNAGTFWNEGNTAVSESSDYAYIENNRVIDKADRGIYASLLPALGSPLIVNADGTLTNETIAYLTGLAKVNLDQMVRDQELSAYAIVINPAQNVLSTSTLIITVQLVPVGVARTIEVNIGYTVSIQS